MCLRDHRGNFIKAKNLCFSPVLEVTLGETMGLHYAITCVRELGFKVFEMDAKFEVDAFNPIMYFRFDYQ